MIFVPVVPGGPHAPPSPRTRELADLLVRVVEEYEKHHPAVTGAEVRAALHMASGRTRGGAGTPQVVLALVAGLLLLMGALALLFARGGL